MGLEEVIKGKTPMFMEQSIKQVELKLPSQPWSGPPPIWVTHSVDGSFCAQDGSVGSGVILQDDKGIVIFAAYRWIFHCNEALKLEIHVTMEGVSLAIQWSKLPVKL
jgi:hypothetical protein